MRDQRFEETRGSLTLTTDRQWIDLEGVYDLLRAEHWGWQVTRPVLQRSIENSVCVGVYDTADNDRQLSFARVVTDLATYAYLTDVVVAPAARGKGVGQWMIEAILAHPDLQGLRRVTLLTRDAHELYKKFGFSTDMPTSTYMELRPQR
ncbi:MAG TPA: GNAT family N-acetyltransferase [Gemmatimonadaceae bacterium]|jgi:GNAT superfamily N-acetyltransferase